MNVLIGCEWSGRVRDAFIARGHNAVSCDIIPSESVMGGGKHILDRLQNVIQSLPGKYSWDMLIAFPPCQFVCGSGLHWNDRGRGWGQTEAALVFVREILGCGIPKIAMENPVGIISTRIRPPDQIIQPYDFGEDASKKTCLWLKGLLPLRPTLYIPPRAICTKCGFVERAAHEVRERMIKEGCPECGAGKKFVKVRWANQTDSGQNKLAPSERRAKDRGITYLGVAKAMAEQWG